MRPLQTDLGRALGLGLLLGLLLGGCGAKGVMRTFDVSPERTATLTVIRPSIAGFAFRFPVYLDGDHVLGLGAREHATITIPAGVRRVGLPKGYDFVEVEVDAKPGDHIYVVIDPSPFFYSKPVLVSASRGRELMSGTSRIE